MKTFSEGYVPATAKAKMHRPSLEMVLSECARQHADALNTTNANDAVVDTIAKKIAAAKAVTFLGMGASHHANLIAATRLRTLGFAAIAIPASEALYAPITKAHPIVLTTQSGGSAEVVRWLAENGTASAVGGVTLSADLPFGDVPTLVAHGGPERAFAATRSFTLTLAALSTLLIKLGCNPSSDGIPAEEPLVSDQVDEIVTCLSSVQSIIFSGRAAFEGLAQLAALSAIELSRRPAFALEGGQFRHGPIEVLSPGVGVVLFRSADRSAHAWSGIAEICKAAKAQLFVFDASNEPQLDYAHTLKFKAGAGLSAIYDLLPTLQAMVIGLGAAHIDDVGSPLYCSKVTKDE